jgi:hypothetical protein
MRKAQQGKNHNFIWQSPAPLSGTPSIAFYLEGGSVGGAMTQGRSDLVATDLDRDRRAITLSASATALKPFQSDAFLLTDADTFFAIKIVRIAGNQLVLADPLPRDISFTANSTIQFASWLYTCSSSDVTASKQTIAYAVEYVQSEGGQTINRVEKGSLKVVPRPFDTGLDHNKLCSIFPHVADLAPRRSNGFEEQISSSLDELALYVRDLIVPRDVDEDDIHNSHDLLQAHAYLAIARIHELNGNIDLSEKMRARGIELADLSMKTISLDLNTDGIIQTTENNQRVSASKDIRGNFAGRIVGEYEAQFIPARNMRW